jgi:ABC-2 type transport system ATP-binding protein
MKIIDAQNVNKSYGKITALQDVSLKVEKGKIFALLGPNGAGKTTFIKCLLGLLKPDAGKFSINEINAYWPQSRKFVAYLPEKFNFYSYYNVQKTLEFFGNVHGIAPASISSYIESALAHLNIHELRKRKIKSLSKGQLQRVGIASLLMSDAELLVMDEPMSGLDPIGNKELKDLMLKLRGKGKTLFVNTHILTEVEQICDHIGILHRGKLLVSGEVKELIKTESLENYFYKLIKGQKDNINE